MADDEEAIDAFVALVRPFGIKELVRTGRVAMVRGSQGVTRAPSAEELAHPTHRPRYDPEVAKRCSTIWFAAS